MNLKSAQEHLTGALKDLEGNDTCVIGIARTEIGVALNIIAAQAALEKPAAAAPAAPTTKPHAEK